MKFTQLKIGERFHYRNAHYTKSGPLQAIEDGSANPKLMMRSAIVQITAGQKTSHSPAHSDKDRLRLTINAYHEECRAVLQATAADINALDSLERRYQELLQILEEVEPI